jgi:predicted Fe-Mo cluster-binding NifX family protein/NAD-dependent dihydropyrimidine dehydrogenase PreA subunit
MKIAVTAKGKTLDDHVDPRFGRCPYFLVIDTETLKVEPVENPNLTLGGGAGIQSAQLMAEHEVKAVLTGNCGPNAYQTLKAADIEVIVGVSGTVREAVEQFKLGALSSTQSPNVASHFGMGAGTEGSGAQTSAPPMDTGMGGGMGMGRGMGGGGGGRGGGRGMGMGGGGGRGMGRGMGMGGGRGMAPGMGVAPGVAELPSSPTGAGEVDALRSEAQNLEAQLHAINTRIGQLASSRAQRRLLAIVDADKCTACGLCEKVCPARAITIEKIAVIDAAKCTGCGQCVAECPQDALTLKKG